eukprot:g11839.t1
MSFIVCLVFQMGRTVTSVALLAFLSVASSVHLMGLDQNCTFQSTVFDNIYHQNQWGGPSIAGTGPEYYYSYSDANKIQSMVL